MQLGCNQGAKGCNPKSLQKHAKTGKREGEDEKKGAIKQAEKQAKSQPAEGRNQGAIRVQLGCNQGAKGCNPKSVPKTRKNGPSWASQYQHEVGRASTERRLGEPLKKPTPTPQTVGRTIEKKKSETPPKPVGRTIEKKNETPPKPVGRTNAKPKPPGLLGEPVLGKT